MKVSTNTSVPWGWRLSTVCQVLLYVPGQQGLQLLRRISAGNIRQHLTQIKRRAPNHWPSPSTRLKHVALALAPHGVLLNSQLRPPAAKGRSAFSAKILLMCSRPTAAWERRLIARRRIQTRRPPDPVVRMATFAMRLLQAESSPGICERQLPVGFIVCTIASSWSPMPNEALWPATSPSILSAVHSTAPEKLPVLLRRVFGSA